MAGENACRRHLLGLEEDETEWKCPMEQEIPGISKFPESLDNLERLTEIFETSFRKISVPFDFAPEFPEILVEWNAPIVTTYIE